MAKSLSRTVLCTGSVTPSMTTVSMAPLASSTPSTSRKMTLDLSSGGSLGLARWFFSAAFFAASSFVGSGGGRKS